MIPTILYEDNDILVCEKPAGVPSQSDKTSDYDMVNRLKNYLYNNSSSNAIPYIGLVHRLDRPVAGLMVFAKTPFATKELSHQIQERMMCKKYLAVVTADLSDSIGKEKQLLTDYIAKNSKTNLSSIVSANSKMGKKAQLYYCILATKKDSSLSMPVSSFVSLIEVELITGRHHQIRVQLASHIGGIWGDTKYNPIFQDSLHQNWTNIALYAYDLTFLHPKTKKKLHFRNIPESDIFQFSDTKIF